MDLITTRTVRLFTLGALVGAAALSLPAQAHAQPCAASILNGSCSITIDRETPASPLPVRVTSGATVTIAVSRRPLEKIVFDLALADIAAADPIAAIFAAFLPGLQGLTVSVSAPPPPGKPTPPPPPAPSLSPAAASVEQALAEMRTEQLGLEPALEAVDGKIRRVGLQLRAFRETPAGTWTPVGLSTLRTDFYCAVHGHGASIGAVTCPSTAEGAGTAPLPIGVVNALGVRLKDVLDRYAALSQAERAQLATQLDVVAGGQTKLEASMDSLRQAQNGLLTVAAMVKDINPATVSVNASMTAGGFPAHTSRTATIKIAAQDLVTKEATNLATVVVHFGGTRWEVSAGALFSAVRNRTFENAPIIVNGEAQRDGGGILTRVVETQTRPVVVPAALAHYRLWEGLAGGPDRIAVLATGAIGINPHSKSADMALGGSLSYRGFMVSPMLHWVRDIRLTNGLEPGQELGSSPPPLTTERHWVRKLAIGLSYRVPF